jgi:phospholipid/cholesterol/gamma-HCH transport system permease protein
MQSPPEKSKKQETEKFFISKRVDGFFLSIFDVFKFIARFFKEVFLPPYEMQEVVRQCFNVGYKSLALISLTGFITGVVFTKQSRPSLAEFGATSWLPSLVSIAIIRALAPLITVGSNIGAELGSMKVTEQIEAMEVSATNPFKYLVVTRILSTTLMLPVLMMYTGFVGMFGAYLNVHAGEATSWKTFFEDAFSSISFLDLYASITKSLLFGFTIGVAGCYQGYNASKGTEGVGRAANAAVVVSMFLIFVEEMFVVQIVNAIRPL